MKIISIDKGNEAFIHEAVSDSGGRALIASSSITWRPAQEHFVLLYRDHTTENMNATWYRGERQKLEIKLQRRLNRTLKRFQKQLMEAKTK